MFVRTGVEGRVGRCWEGRELAADKIFRLGRMGGDMVAHRCVWAGRGRRIQNSEFRVQNDGEGDG